MSAVAADRCNQRPCETLGVWRKSRYQVRGPRDPHKRRPASCRVKRKGGDALLGAEGTRPRLPVAGDFVTTALVLV